MQKPDTNSGLELSSWAIVLYFWDRGTRTSAESVRENTPAAFELALQHGCDGFEFDLRRTRDGQVVVCHDLVSGSMKVSSSRRSQLPELAELSTVFHSFHHRAFLDIELKVSGIETVVLSELRQHKIDQDYVVSSFLVDVIMELKARSASVPVGIICERLSQLEHWRKLPVDFVILEKSLVHQKLVEEIQATNRKLIAWTVNDKETMLRLASWRVDGIISDDTKLLCDVLKR